MKTAALKVFQRICRPIHKAHKEYEGILLILKHEKIMFRSHLLHAPAIMLQPGAELQGI